MTLEYAPRRDGSSGKRVMPEASYEAAVALYSPDGVRGAPSDQAPIIMSGGRPVFRAGVSGLLRGYHWVTIADIPISIANNSTGSTRRDLITVRLDRAVNPREVKPNVLQGVPGASRLPPVMQDGPSGVFDLPLAEASIPAGGGAATAVLTRLCWYVGRGGQILCTPDTRPPHSRGLRIFETTNARELMSDGAKWLVSTERTDKQTLPLASGWAASSYNALRRVNGWVSLTITIQRTGNAIARDTAVTFGTLPVGYRPDEAFESLAFAPSSGDARISVAANGVCQVTCYGGLNTSRFVNLDPLRFPAAAI